MRRKLAAVISEHFSEGVPIREGMNVARAPSGVKDVRKRHAELTAGSRIVGVVVVAPDRRDFEFRVPPPFENREGLIG